MQSRKWYPENRNESKSSKKFRLNSFSSAFCQKFAFANAWERILLVFGILFAVVAGACLPLIVLLFADLVTIFIQYQLKKEAKEDHSYFQNLWANHMRFTFIKHNGFVFDSKNLGKVIELYAIETTFLGVIIFLFTFAYTCILNYVAERQMTKVKVQYLSALLKQPVDQSVSYHEVFVKAHRNLQHYSTSVGDNFGTMILSFSVFVTSLGIAFMNHELLTAMLFVLFLVLAVILFFSILIYRYLTETEKNHYQIAENLAKDIFLNIHTVKAYEGESIEIRRFDKLLVTSQTAGINTWMFFGFVIGLLYILLYTSYALTFWQGMSMALELKNKNETPDILIIVNFCMQICFVNFLKIPIFLIISRNAAVAYEEMTRVIRSASRENSLKSIDNEPLSDLSFISVYFSYSPDEKPLLNNVNVQIPPRSLICVIGGPKTGKSTFLKLLIKLQKTKGGIIRIGKYNIEELRGSAIRNRIGYVSQKTALFGDTIRNALKGNINLDSESGLIEACRLVNVHTAVLTLQKGYDSPLSPDLSDEVKEKLVIARALMKGPDVLILDDCMANINLITQMAILSEFLSQNQKTVIIVTNKLDIIKSSDLIIYFKPNEVETGTLPQLISDSGKFRSLIERAELDGVITDFETGVPVIKSRYNRVLDRISIGLSPNEMIANEVVINRLPNNEKQFSDQKLKQLEEKSKQKINCWKVLSLNRREFLYLTTAAIAATIMGFSIPAYATIFGESLGTIVLSSKNEIEENINFFPQMFLVAGLISGIAKMVEGYMIAVACSKLTKRLRKQAFEAFIYKDVAFYDNERNHMTALLTLLREDARIVPLAAGPEMVLFIKVGGIIIISTLVSLYNSWKLGLVVLGFSPFLFYGLYYLSRFQNSGVYEKKFTKANEFVSELFKHAETLQTLNLVDYQMSVYQELLTSQRSPCMESLKTKALLFGYSQTIPYFAYAVCMLYGGILLKDDEITFTSFFKVLESLILGTVLLSQVLMVIPNRRPCLRSCAKLLNLIPSQAERARALTRSRFEIGNYVNLIFEFDLLYHLGLGGREKFKLTPSPTLGFLKITKAGNSNLEAIFLGIGVNIWKNIGVRAGGNLTLNSHMPPMVTIGYVKMKHVNFIHPYNNLVPRLQEINLQINERQTIIALTGFLNSGSCIPVKLLNQFYKQTSGSIMIDEFDLSREFSLKALRKNIGLVDGRDRFFRRTVARNISYSINSSRDVIETYIGMDDIVAVAKEADIHNFIITLPEGYYTIMTEEICKKMTPGQILRLSLAKALLRDPRLLVMENIGIEIDEGAQTLMETAILKACFSRTVILSSSFPIAISNIADFIYYFENGSVKEFGKHQKLMEKKGSYYKLYEQQREELRQLRDFRLGYTED